MRVSCVFLCAEYAPLKPKKREGKDSMEAAIFQASKKRGQTDEDEEDEGADGAENQTAGVEGTYEGGDDDAHHFAPQRPQRPQHRAQQQRQLVPQDDDDEYDPAL